MASFLTSGRGDNTSTSPKPDFDSGKGWAWEKMTKEARAAGTVDKFPRSPRKGLAEQTFWKQVDTHMSRKCFIMPASIKDGRVIRE